MEVLGTMGVGVPELVGIVVIAVVVVALVRRFLSRRQNRT